MSSLVRSEVQIQYQSITAPILPPAAAAFDPANGFPYVPAPNATPRPQPALIAAIVAGAFFTPPISAASVSQIGIDRGEPPKAFYPDQCYGAPRTADFPSLAYVPALSRWGIDSGQIPWNPVYPDQPGRAAPRLIEASQQFLAYGQASERWGIDRGEVSWAPTYPDQPGRTAPDPNRWTGDFSFLPDLGSFSIPALAWAPRYPDRVPGPAPIVLEGGSFFTRLEASAVPALSWGPLYPDFARAAPNPNTRIGLFAFLPDLPSFAIPTLAWGPSYPDQPGRPPSPLVVSSLTEVAYIPATGQWGLDSGQAPWRPIYPDFAGRGLLPLNVGSLTTFAYVPAISRWGLDATPWRPKYPDFARGARSANEWAGAFAFLPDLPSFPLPAPLVWKPRYPDFARRSRAATEWEGKFSLVVPTSVLPVPELSWSPIWPDFARTAPHSVEELTTFAMRPFAPIWTAYEAILLWEPDKYGGVPTVYFEAVLETTAGRAYARVVASSTSTPLAGSEISTAEAAATRVRSAAVSMPVVATLYRAEIGALPGSTVTIRAARLVIET